MHPLNRKLTRDLWQMRSQAAAIALVIACGIGAFVMSLSTLASLQLTQATYYEQFRFADVFASLKRAPQALERRIAQIPGVAQVQTRVVVDVNLDVEGLPEPAVGRLISIPDDEPPALNRLYLRRGRYPRPRAGHEALVGEAFAQAHGLELGDRVRAIINGRLDELILVGVALSPEYVLQMRQGQVLPDPQRFGVFWMRREALAAAYDMEGAFNDVTLALAPGASEAQVIERLDELIEPYGGIGSYGREDQLSHRYLSDEIKQLRAMGLIAPSIFLSVAAFLLNVVVSRLIGTQREQIAALKAFGYTNLEVGRHYLRLVMAITVAGVVLGVALGVWMGLGLTTIYTQFYHFPLFRFHVDVSVILLTLGIAALAGGIGTAGAIRRAVRLPPAQAMRPEPPASYRPTVLERMGLQRLLTESTRMVLRHLERRPLKAMFSSLGIALAVAVLVLGRFSADAVDYLMAFQFDFTQRQDMNVTFVEPSSAQAVYDVRSLPGVMRAEPFRSVAARLRHGHRERRVAIMGIEPGGTLYRVVDDQRGPLELPPDGLVMSVKLAELLQVRPGQMVTVQVREGKRPVRQVPVADLVDDFAGTNAYMNVHALRRLMQEGGTVSGVFLRVDEARTNQLYLALKQTPRVASVTVKRAMVESFEQTISENQQRIRMFNVAFAIVIAFGVVYNTVRISLAENSRELATLRVIGFSRAEVSAILLGELAVLTLAAIPVGLMMGYGLAWLATLSVNTEMFRIPLVVSRATLGFASAVVLAAALGSGLVVRRRIDRLDLVSVLKAKE